MAIFSKNPITPLNNTRYIFLIAYNTCMGNKNILVVVTKLTNEYL